MGKSIDLTQPLSPEDRAWLEERGKFDDLRVAAEYAAIAAESAAQTADDDDEDDEQDTDSEEYGTWSKAQMQYELGLRDLPQSGTKAELVARLEADDAAKEDSA